MATPIKLFCYAQAVFYTFAGINHFIQPQFYLPLIPDYLPFPKFINLTSGILEICFGLMLFAPKTRLFAAWCIFLMLIAFIPSHVYFIQLGSCIDDGLCVPPWIGWARLLVIHPLLLWSIYRVRDK